MLTGYEGTQLVKEGIMCGGGLLPIVRPSQPQVRGGVSRDLLRIKILGGQRQKNGS